MSIELEIALNRSDDMKQTQASQSEWLEWIEDECSRIKERFDACDIGELKLELAFEHHSNVRAWQDEEYTLDECKYMNSLVLSLYEARKKELEG